jgi:LPXTG-motif cell wall-anchored protein
VGNENGNNDFEAFNRKGEPLTGEEARLFGRNAIVGLDDRLPVTAGKTIVEDAGLYKLAGATAPNKPAGNGAAQNAAGSLPVTGAAAGGLLGAGALLLAGGGVLLLVARRRRPVTSPTE